MKQKYVAHYRVSTTKQKDSNLSLLAQQQAVTRYVEGVGGELVAEYTEVESGGNKDRVNTRNRSLSWETILTKRPVLRTSIDHAERLGAILIVKSLDRLSRFSTLVNYVLDYKVRFVCSDSPTDTPMIMKMKVAIAEDELEKVSTRTIAALEQKKRQGVTLGNNGYGMPSKTRLKGVQAIKDNAANSIRNIQAMDIVCTNNKLGLSLQGIANKLNQKGYKTSRGATFQKITVKRLLERCPHE